MSGSALALRYGMAFAVAFLVTLALVPIAAKVARRLGILDHPRENKFHVHATPYLGGVAVAGGLVLVGAVAGGASGRLLTILLGGLAMAAVGLVDDWRTVRPEVKIIVEVGAGLALWVAGIRASVFGIYALDLATTLLWVVAVTNALNLIDNMDGLSAGISGLAALSFFAVAASRGDYLVGSFALAIAGSSLAFLPYNFPPARIFLGDSGSLFLGFLLAALALEMDLVGKEGLIRAAVPALIVGVPLFDMLLVIISRVRRGKRIYQGGTDHSSHRLALLGLSGRYVALVIYLTQLCLSALALWLLVAPKNVDVALVLGTAVVSTVGLVMFLRLDGQVGDEAGARGTDWQQPERGWENASLWSGR